MCHPTTLCFCKAHTTSREIHAFKSLLVARSVAELSFFKHHRKAPKPKKPAVFYGIFHKGSQLAYDFFAIDYANGVRVSYGADGAAVLEFKSLFESLAVERLT